VGVPGLETGGGLLDPPQATRAAASRTRNSDPKASFNRRLLVGISSRKKAAKTAPPMGRNQRGLLNRPITVDGAVVFTVSVVVPVGIIEGEASEQLPPVIVDGTVQLKLTVPVKPLMALRLIVVVPDAPGAEMANEDGLATTL
jgi:hypothetical protein